MQRLAILALVAPLATSCHSSAEPGRPVGVFPGGDVSIVPSGERSQHPATVDPVQIEASLDRLGLESLEAPGHTGDLFPPEVLEEASALLAQGLGQAVPGEAVRLHVEWVMVETEGLRFRNAVTLLVLVREGALHVKTTAAQQWTEGAAAADREPHPLRVVPRESGPAGWSGTEEEWIRIPL